jgi:hypothetical protein
VTNSSSITPSSITSMTCWQRTTLWKLYCQKGRLTFRFTCLLK